MLKAATTIGLLVTLGVGSAKVTFVRAQTAPQVKSPRLYVFDCGVLKRGEPTAYNLTREQVGVTDFSDACYLIVHPKGTLLWDVGIIPDDLIKPGGVELALPNTTNTNKAEKRLRSQLAEIGFTAAGITYFATSHAHGDHVANANDYAGSTWLVQKAERDQMFREQARQQAAFANYRALENAKTVLLNGDHDVFGDGSVVIKSTPGHTPGHQSLFVKLSKTGPVVLSGDLYHYAAERTLKKIPNNDVKEQTAASRAALDEFMRNTKAQLWIQHDIVENAKLRKFPAFYE